MQRMDRTGRGGYDPNSHAVVDVVAFANGRREDSLSPLRDGRLRYNSSIFSFCKANYIFARQNLNLQDKMNRSPRDADGRERYEVFSISGMACSNGAASSWNAFAGYRL